MKRQFRINSKRKLLTACAFLFLGLAYQSCRKSDSLPVDRKEQTVASKFFALPVGTDPLVKRVAREMEKRNTKNEFVTKFEKENGKPVWDKAIIFASSGNTPSPENFANAGGADDSLAYIPFVLNNGSSVNGYILAVVNDSINLNYSLAQDYKAYPFTTESGVYSASQFSLNMMLLDNAVFGTTEFAISDHRLFSTDTAHKKIDKVRIAPPTYSSLYTVSICVEVSTYGWVCTTPDERCCYEDPRGCDHCGVRCTEEEITTEMCYNHTNPGETGGDGTGTGTSTGGTSGGGGPSVPHYYPCPGSTPVSGFTGTSSSNYTAP